MSVKIVYFDANRAALVRLILVVAGADFEERQITRREWMDMNPSKKVRFRQVSPMCQKSVKPLYNQKIARLDHNNRLSPGIEPGPSRYKHAP